MAKSSIALTELFEKGPDIDLVRDMLHKGAKLLTVCVVKAAKREV